MHANCLQIILLCTVAAVDLRPMCKEGGKKMKKPKSRDTSKANQDFIVIDLATRPPSFSY